MMLNTVRTTIEVRYQETDQMGVVYHANYLVWFEIGRTKLIESLGFNYADMEKQQVVSPVIDVKISYRKPVRYDEKVIIETWIESYNGIRTTYGFNVINVAYVIVVIVYTEHVIVNKVKFCLLLLCK